MNKKVVTGVVVLILISFTIVAVLIFNGRDNGVENDAIVTDPISGEDNKDNSEDINRFTSVEAIEQAVNDYILENDFIEIISCFSNEIDNEVIITCIANEEEGIDYEQYKITILEETAVLESDYKVTIVFDLIPFPKYPTRKGVIRATSKDSEDSTGDYLGTVTIISQNSENIISNEGSRPDAARISISSDVEIVTKGGESIKFDELKIGMYVESYYRGDSLDTYPRQEGTEKIVVDTDYSLPITEGSVTPRFLEDVLEGQNLAGPFPIYLDGYETSYEWDDFTFSFNLVEGGEVYYTDSDNLADPYIFHGPLSYTITSELGFEETGKIDNVLIRPNEKLDVFYKDDSIAFDVWIFEEDELMKVNCSIDENGKLAKVYYPRIYKNAVEKYTESDASDYDKQQYFYTLNRIQDIESLAMVKPSNEGYKSEFMSLTQLKAKVNPEENYKYALEKSANEIYMVEVYEDKTIIDIYAVNYVKPYDTNEFSLSLEGQVEFDYVLENLITSINTIGLLHYDNNNDFVIDITDRELNIIETIILAEDLNIVSMMHDYNGDGLIYVFTVTDDEIRQSGENNKQVVIRCSYNNYDGLHFVYDVERRPIGNGQILDSMWWHGPNGPYDFSSHAGYRVISTNEAAVVALTKGEDERVYPRLYINEYVLFCDGNANVVEVREYNSKVENSPIYDLNVFGYHIQADQYGNVFYLEDESFDFVKLDEEFNEVKRYTNLDDEVIGCLKAADSYVNWTIDENYLVALDGENSIYSLNLGSLVLNQYDIDDKNIQFENYHATINDDLDKYEYYDVNLNEFISAYKHPEGSFYNESYFEYEGVAYYESDPDINVGAVPSIRDRDDILPESMAPRFTYLGETVEVLESKKYENTTYYKLINGYVGFIDDEKFSPLIKEEVRDYVVHDGDIIFIGYEADSNVIKYYSDNVITSLSEKYAVDSVTIFNEYVYYTTHNSELKKVRLSALKSGTGKGKAVVSLQQLAGDSVMSLYYDNYRFEVESTDDYIVAYDSGNHKTIIFNEDESLREIMNSSFKYLTEDNYIITGILSFIARHDIDKGTDSLIAENYFFYPDMRFANLLLNCTPYEGPSWIDGVEIYGEEINMHREYKGYTEDVDYSIEIGNSHQSYIIVYDHKLKKLYLHNVIWSRPDYELTEEGLKYWYNSDDYNIEGFIPLRENAKVQVYWTKRT